MILRLEPRLWTSNFRKSTSSTNSISIPGNHSASYFGAHIGEVMEFHSKMFAAEK